MDSFTAFVLTAKQRGQRDIHRANVEGNFEGGRPRRTFSEQSESTLKQAGVSSKKNRKTCMTILTIVS